jgi:hypothetical protein
LKYCFIDFSKFIFKEVQKADYESKDPFAYLNHHWSEFVVVAFFDSQRAIYYFAWPPSRWNIDPSTSRKSFYKTSRKQIMSSKVHSPTLTLSRP